jgi:hypothetical protein
LLLALDKYHIYLRKLKQIRLEAVKSNLAANKSNQIMTTKSTNKMGDSTNLKFQSKILNQNEGKESESDIAESVNGKFI